MAVLGEVSRGPADCAPLVTVSELGYMALASHQMRSVNNPSILSVTQSIRPGKAGWISM